MKTNKAIAPCSCLSKRSQIESPGSGIFAKGAAITFLLIRLKGVNSKDLCELSSLMTKEKSIGHQEKRNSQTTTTKSTLTTLLKSDPNELILTWY